MPIVENGMPLGILFPSHITQMHTQRDTFGMITAIMAEIGCSC